MNINERLKEIERVLNHIKNDSEFQPHEFIADDLHVQWMHDTIKQLQEESQNRFESILHGDEENLILQQHIAELEKEKEILIHNIIADLIANLKEEFDRDQAIEAAEMLVKMEMEGLK